MFDEPKIGLYPLQALMLSKKISEIKSDITADVNDQFGKKPTF